MGFVGMQEAGLRTGGKRLEGELRTCCLQGAASENLARDLDGRTQFQHEFVQFAQFAESDCTEILGFGDLFNLFHRLSCFKRFSDDGILPLQGSVVKPNFFVVEVVDHHGCPFSERPYGRSFTR